MLCGNEEHKESLQLVSATSSEQKVMKLVKEPKDLFMHSDGIDFGLVHGHSCDHEAGYPPSQN